MKKWLSVLLALCLMLSMVACGGSSGDDKQVAATEGAKDQRFRVGYARENITPDHPVGLKGYGNTSDRKHTEVLDYIYLTTVVVTDYQDNTMIMITVDVGSFQ